MPLPVPGSHPPDFVLADSDGRQVSLASHLGHNVVIWFFSRAFGSN